jgi:hypothetical protein
MIFTSSRIGSGKLHKRVESEMGICTQFAEAPDSVSQLA